MHTKILEELRQSYPSCHLHCDMKLAGQNSYRILVAVIDAHGKEIASIEHFGTGELEYLKAQAYELLYRRLEKLSASPIN